MADTIYLFEKPAEGGQNEIRNKVRACIANLDDGNTLAQHNAELQALFADLDVSLPADYFTSERVLAATVTGSIWAVANSITIINGENVAENITS